MERRIKELEEWIEQETLAGCMEAYSEPNIFDTELAKRLKNG